MAIDFITEDCAQTLLSEVRDLTKWTKLWIGAGYEEVNWPLFVQYCRIGLGPKLFKIGEEIPSTYTNGSTTYSYPWIVVDFQSVQTQDGYTFNNIPILQAKYLMHESVAFDAKEPSNPNEYYRSYGEDRWARSFIRQCLNSSGTGWWTAQTEYDVCASSSRKGFMTYMPQEMVESLHSIKKTTALNASISAIEGKDVDVTYDKFWLASASEMNLDVSGRVNLYLEGSPWQYYKNLFNSDTPVAMGTHSQMIRYRCNNTTSACIWWMRSSHGNSYGVRDVTAAGNDGDASGPYNGGYYALPCCAIV